jgi:hypothetical protein
MKVTTLFLILLVGIALGVGGMIFAPDMVDPYLPDAFRAKKAETVEGEVVRKVREGDHLLLTVQTSQGTVLATFRKKMAEIDLLVQQGDAVTLALSRYEPFVTDPAIERVRKPDVAVRPKDSPLLPPAVGEIMQEKPPTQ